MSEFTIKGDIQKLRLKKGDYVILKVKTENVSMQKMAEIDKHAREIFPDNKIVVLPAFIDIDVKGA
jgi:hypothetical protein